MTGEPTTEEQYRKPTLGEDVRELFSRVAKLNDIASALLDPSWGASAGILPEGHPLYPDVVEPPPSHVGAAEPGCGEECAEGHVYAGRCTARQDVGTEFVHRADAGAWRWAEAAEHGPGWDPVTGHRTWEQVQADGPQFTSIRGLLEHVGIDTTGRTVTVAGKTVDPAPADEELTAEEARALVDDLGLQLYRAQDALAFVGECCDIADRKGEQVTTAQVREWLKGARCGRQLAADRATDTGTDDGLREQIETALRQADEHSCQTQDGVSYPALTNAVLPIVIRHAEQLDARATWLDASARQAWQAAAERERRAEQAEAAIARVRALEHPFVMRRDILAALGDQGAVDEGEQPPTAAGGQS